MNEFHYCLAFPDGIPDEIEVGSNPHSEVHPDQEGSYVYEADDKEDEELTLRGSVEE
jgi:hypothetical protein